MLEAIHVGRKRPGRALASVLLVEGLSGAVVSTLESLPHSKGDIQPQADLGHSY